jgi:plastocyanin
MDTPFGDTKTAVIYFRRKYHPTHANFGVDYILKMKKYILFPLLFVAILLIGFACKKTTTNYNNPSSSSGTPGSNEVFMQNNSFNPGNLTVAVGATVKWTNKDGVGHTVTSTTGEFNSGTIASGGTFTHQFNTAGTYPYRCTIHSNMNGTITVQ